MRFLIPKQMSDWKKLIREEGFKSFIKKKGWKVLLWIVIFYTIRDGILYLLFPYLIYKGVF